MPEVKTKSATDKQIAAAKESISKGDKQAIKDSDLKGGLKRQAKRSAGKSKRKINQKSRIKERDTNQKDREMAKADKEANKYEGKADKQAEKTDKKKTIKDAGSRKAARLMDKSDAAKKAESSERESYNALETTRGKGKKIIAKAYKQVGKKEAKTDKVGSRLEKEQKKVVEKSKKDDRKKSEKDTKIANKKTNKDIKSKDKKTIKTQKAELASAGSTDTKISGTMRGSVAKNMGSFDQMDSQNAMATAGETPVEMSGGPIKYFKGKINYDIKEASNSNLSQSARNNYAKNAQHDMKSMAPMYDAPSKMYDSPVEKHGKIKKGGSILSKHMKK